MTALWQNSTQSVTLVDIPRSIAAAQGTAECHGDDALISTEPLLAAFPCDKPKTAAAKAKIANNSVDHALHQEYEVLLQQAIEEVKLHYKDNWYLERSVIAQSAKRKRLVSDDRTTENGTYTSRDAQNLPASILDQFPYGLEAPGNASCMCGDEVEDARFLTNCEEKPSICVIKDKSEAFTFRLPPASSCYIGDCIHSRDFHKAVRTQASAHNTSRFFDFVVLDPPWPNRSVKRTHRTAGATYKTLPTLDTIHDLLIGMDLDMLMADQCFVGVWITNKQAVRELVLGEGGIFAQWGVELEEEWIWLKTTTSGEPIMPFDNLWRKPYEVLLLGRKHRTRIGRGERVQNEVKRKVLIGIPDLHSRKPCLKYLMEPLLPQNYRALEVFARHLVAGWWSWGKECIKYNWNGYWRAPHHDIL